MKENVLTIAIPTFNRASYIKENLEVLIPQCKKYKGAVKIVVSDNASTDDTPSVLEGLYKSFPDIITYSINSENIGVQGNFSKVVESSNSQYVFLLGDDDIMSPNFLDIIMPYLIGEAEYGIIHWGRLVGDADCSNNFLHNPYFKELIGIYSVNDFIINTVASTNFLSSCLFNRKCWTLGGDSEDKEMLGWGYYSRFMLGAIRMNAPCIHYYLPLVLMRNPNRVWAKNWPIYFWHEMFTIFKHLDIYVPGAYEAWVQRSKDDRFYNRSGILLSMYKDPIYYSPYFSSIEGVLSNKEKFLFRIIRMKPKNTLIGRIYFRFVLLLYRFLF